MSAISPSDARLGIIGCGNIFERYMRGLARYQNLAVMWCSDVDLALARARAQQFEIPSWGTLDEMLEYERIDVAINLTPPNVHAATSSSALEAGKHIYTEKPLAATLDNAAALIRTASARNSATSLSFKPPTWPRQLSSPTASSFRFPVMSPVPWGQLLGSLFRAALCSFEYSPRTSRGYLYAELCIRRSAF